MAKTTLLNSPCPLIISFIFSPLLFLPHLMMIQMVTRWVEARV